MIRSKTLRRIKFSVALIFLVIIIIYFRLERQRQFATANILNVINEMEKSWNSSATALLEPVASHRCQSSGHGLFLLVMVMSGPGNFESRRVIRSTWAEMRGQWEAEFLSENQNFEITQVFRLLFFLGQPRGNISNDIQNEWDEHGDLVIDDFHESYLTLTLKTSRMLRWATLSCSGAQYVMKLDDDVFVHVPKLLKSLSNFSESRGRGERLRVILGYVVPGTHVYRDPFSKFFTPKILYSRENYPNYTSGICYVLGMGAAQEIVDLLEGPMPDLKLLHMEDVFVTGIVGNERLGIPLQEIGPILPNFYFEVDSKSLTFDPDQDLNPNRKTKSLQWVLQHVLIHKVTSDQIRCWTKLTGQGQRSLAEDC